MAESTYLNLERTHETRKTRQTYLLAICRMMFNYSAKSYNYRSLRCAQNWKVLLAALYVMTTIVSQSVS